jgi:integral membrane protein
LASPPPEKMQVETMPRQPNGETDPGGGPGAGVLDHGLLVRYRVMAFTTATLLIVLVFVGIPLQFAAGRPEVVNDVGTIHGFMYLIYLYVAFQLTRKLRIPKWQMALVLLAGTVPFCAFVAERKMTRRFEASGVLARPSPETGRSGSSTTYASRVRKRWFSRRALLLHLEVAIIAPGCVLAGWWQATRALAGNALSWVYSIEWPVFALLAIAGWWYLIHEDPEAYKARKQAPRPSGHEVPVASTASHLGPQREVTVEATTARLATMLIALVGLEFALGIVALIFVPVGRPSGWLPTRWPSIYLVHAVLGLPLAFGAAALLLRVRRSTRLSRLSGWIGATGVAIAGAGGLVTVAHPLRLAGMAFMLVGTLVAGFGYLIPALEKSS